MTLPKYIQGVIFDLDGTLLDSLEVWHDVDTRFFAKRGMPLPEGYAKAILSMSLPEAAIYTKTEYNLPDSPEALVEEWLLMVKEEFANRVEMKPYAKELLMQLFQSGIKLGVATSSAKELFLPCLKRHGVAHLFTAFTETREAPRGKNFPDPYLLAAERLHLKPQNCAVFEDILVGVRSAKLGGFYTVAISDFHSRTDEPALRAEADLFITSFQELLS